MTNETSAPTADAILAAMQLAWNPDGVHHSRVWAEGGRFAARLAYCGYTFDNPRGLAECLAAEGWTPAEFLTAIA